MSLPTGTATQSDRSIDRGAANLVCDIALLVRVPRSNGRIRLRGLHLRSRGRIRVGSRPPRATATADGVRALDHAPSLAATGFHVGNGGWRAPTEARYFRASASKPTSPT